MSKTRSVLVAFCLTLFVFAGSSESGEGPLPKFTYKGVALEAKNLDYGPQGLLERACLIKMEGRIPNPLGKYYLYYSPHKPFGIGLVYSDSIEGPWTEYKDNPVVEHAAIPEVHWIPETGKFHLWAYSKRAQTDMWTSADGLHFEHHSTSIEAKNIGTRNATYTRVYDYPLERYGTKYIMLYSGFDLEREIRCVWLAHSKDAVTWTQVKTPLVEPVEGEGADIYGPSLFRWQGRNFIVYQDHSAYRGGNVKYVELDSQLNPVGAKGDRYVLIDPVPDSPIDNRYRECEFYREGNTLYMYSSGADNPRRIVYATAKVEDAISTEETKPTGNGGKTKGENTTKKTKKSPTIEPQSESNANSEFHYPSVDELPANNKLPDPFQFFGSDRRVKSKEDWEQRQAEMMDMLQHYIYGPAFPQVNKYKVESRTEQLLAGGNVVKYTADLKLGPDLSHPVTISYYLLKNKDSNSILIYVVAREEPQDEDAVEFAKRGYAYTALKVGPYEKIAINIHPEIQGTRTMGWVWGMNEMINYLTQEHQIDKVIITGCSRYGRVALLTGALNKRVDLTAPITTLAHAVHRFDETMWGQGNEKWGNQEYNTFGAKMNRMPVDRHFLGAVIAPRAYLGIIGAEKPAFNQGHVEAYESLVPVYEWLGSTQNLGLYDHSPRGHGVNLDDLHTVLDFSDQIFFNKIPASGKQFDQISNPDLVGFEWKAPPPISVE